MHYRDTFLQIFSMEMQTFYLSLRRFVEELEGIRFALVKEKTNSKVKLVVEEMSSKQARLFSQMDMRVYMGNR